MRSEEPGPGTGPEFDPPALDRIFASYRTALCGSTLLMVGLSWPLWVDEPDFPRVPFARNLPDLPIYLSWLVLFGFEAVLALATIGLRWRLMVAISLPFLTFAIIYDQDRLQPWAYQYALIGLVMASNGRARTLWLARWYVIGLYFYSGLSKLDASFCRELGPMFLSAALRPIGIDPGRWSDSVRTAACTAMPGFEIAVACLLAWPRTRRIGLVASIGQHLALIGLLSPWGLEHSLIVLVWNGSLIVGNLILFGRPTIPIGPDDEPKFGGPARVVFWVAMIWPIGERLGFCDAWPGHALYASHVERSDIFVHEDDLDRYPEAILRRLGPAGVTSWRRLDLNGWSRDARGTPIYPSGRVGNAVAEFLEARYSLSHPVRLVQWGRAQVWDDARERDESVGLAAIRKRARRFLLNAHPSACDSP